VATIEEDEESKKRVQEALWTWILRVGVLAVVFGFGYFAGYVMYGAGDEGAVVLRPKVHDLDSSLNEQKKKTIDCEGRLTVVEGRMQEIQRAMQKAPAPAAP
jgi:hypothetical protein